MLWSSSWKIITASFSKSHSLAVPPVTSQARDNLPHLAHSPPFLTVSLPKLCTNQFGLPYPGTHLHNQYLHDRKPAACPKMLRWRLWFPTVKERKAILRIIRFQLNYFLSLLNQNPVMFFIPSSLTLSQKLTKQSAWHPLR